MNHGMLTPAMRTELQHRRGFRGADALLRIARDAARSVARDLGPDDRAECVAAILAQGLAAVPMARQSRRLAPKSRRHFTPYRRAVAAEQLAVAADVEARADDRAQSFTAYRLRALEWRRAWVLKRDRERSQDEATQNVQSGDGQALVRGLPDLSPPSGASADEAAAVADHVAWRLSQAPYSAVDGASYANVWALLYSAARDLASHVCAADLDCTAATLRKRCERGAAALAARYPDPAELLAALAVDLDDSQEATGPTLHAAAWGARDWRTGTDGGTAPTRAASADEARALCTVRGKSGGRRKPRPISEQEAAEALTRLARAQYRAMHR